jgi:hypothetical protein
MTIAALGRRVSQEGINHYIVSPFPRYNFVLETNQLGKYFLLPMCMKPLVSEVSQAFLISHNHKFS